jgi:long-chain acyl-CoA synthetase
VEAAARAGEARNLVELFEAQAARQGPRAAAFSKRAGRWEETSWVELARRARDVSDGLAALGVAKGDRVAFLAGTTPEAAIADLGILGAGAVSVALYWSSTPGDCAHVLADSGAVLMLCDTEAQVEKIREVRDRLPSLRAIVRFEGNPRDAFERSLASLEELGRDWRRTHGEAHAARLATLLPGDLATIVYTSGTTGPPKGAVGTHGNWLYIASATGSLDLFRPDDVGLLFLPIAHVFARLCLVAWYQIGSSYVFAESVEKILDDAAETHPTFLPSPPRVYEKAFGGVVSKGLSEPGLAGRLFRRAMDGFERWVAAREQGQEHRSLDWLIAKRLVFPKVARALRRRFGGRMRLLVSGAAPLSTRIGWFFQTLGFTMLEGYGLTEVSGVATANRPERNKIGTVGPPIPGTEIRIAGDGEVLVRGPGVMKGYWRNPAATEEAIQDGWYHTGDVGELDRDGFLRITDRKKDIIVTAGGKNVAPQNLESELKTDPLVSQVVVHGDRRKFLSALVTLNEEAVRRWAEREGFAPGEPLRDDPRVRARIQQSVDALNASLASYSTIKKFAILPRDLSVAAGELTPTMKVKRKVCSERYQEILDAFYVE